ncbi:hypothetical protein KM043_017616 [Ampulex compressa]|nr:hypothetical protein KM043_017616 [Ampulex compressa]
MAQLPSGIVSHSKKVCSLYKRSLLCIKDWYKDTAEYRYQAILMRERFDKNSKIRDLRVAKDLLLKGEDELFEYQHSQPLKWPNSPGGVAYGRDEGSPDWVLDFWHPMEKAQYPKYFAIREKRKKEYEEWFYRQYPEERPSKPEIKA